MPAHGGNNSAGKDCLAMGRMPDYFRRRFGTKRSAHPDLSFCAFGPLAKEVLKDHRAQDGVGTKSPSGKLYRMDALVLMLGTGYETCTVMHLAEYAEAERLRAENIIPDTVTCWSKGTSWEEPAFYPERFPAIGEAFEKAKPECIVIRPLPGETAPRELAHRPLARAMRIRDLVDFSIDRYRYLR
jgi:aminoglycoside 3-N-acetyltransferase